MEAPSEVVDAPITVLKKVFNPQIVKEEALNAKRRRRPPLVTALTV